jgi:uncharacterized protein YndB with AHSA1/START domain
MKTITVSTTINRPREEVYDLLDDITAHEQFTDHFMIDWHPTREDPRGVGAGVRVKGKMGPHPDMEITVVEASRPERIVENGRSGKGLKRHTAGTYTLEPTQDGGTLVTFRLDIELAGFGDRVQWPVMRSYLQKQNARAMERLKELMEARETSTAAG